MHKLSAGYGDDGIGGCSTSDFVDTCDGGVGGTDGDGGGGGCTKPAGSGGGCGDGGGTSGGGDECSNAL